MKLNLFTLLIIGFATTSALASGFEVGQKATYHSFYGAVKCTIIGLNEYSATIKYWDPAYILPLFQGKTVETVPCSRLTSMNVPSAAVAQIIAESPKAKGDSTFLAYNSVKSYSVSGTR